jgi:hypothetical protein
MTFRFFGLTVLLGPAAISRLRLLPVRLRTEKRLTAACTKLTAAILIGMASAAGALALPSVARWGQRAGEYDGRFTFVRLRWTSNSFWNHEFPRAEQNLVAMVKRLTLVDANDGGSLNLSLDDPSLFKYPVAVMWEPGFWAMTDAQAERLREYLLKGGFLVFNDFELEQWDTFDSQMQRVLPGAQWVRLDASHPIFDSFFRVENPEVPHAAYHHLAGLTPQYYGLFEHNDRTKRLMAIANYNTNLAEYWQFADRGLFPLEPSNNAFKLGVNFVVYGLTH